MRIFGPEEIRGEEWEISIRANLFNSALQQILFLFSFLAQQTPVGEDLLIHEVCFSRSLTTTHHSR